MHELLKHYQGQEVHIFSFGVRYTGKILSVDDGENGIVTVIEKAKIGTQAGPMDSKQTMTHRISAVHSVLLIEFDPA